ncbi:hypothetical protein N7492_001836 [Penicillium capsulatum]|uniref:Uncharacterized protein n=1 Tax=Penicillium capsulatum TaxID=69766 RepID=A0A9W9IT26_9EURO|nr:hypothetical protein N7492_001836 [Penicillium capsulatum]KAJ6129115.1 hypothetical protein N7512_001895 [Penicillium capsulatum]
MKCLLEPELSTVPPLWAQRKSRQRSSRLVLIVCTVVVLFSFFAIFSHYDEIVHPSSTPRPTWSPSKFEYQEAVKKPQAIPPIASPAFPPRPSPKPGKKFVDALGAPLTKPVGVPIIAVIFYGRRHRASVLECYLRKNLASQGGWLDQVIWAVNTKIPGDIVYAEEITKTAPEYKYLAISTPDEDETHYTQVWYDAFKDENAIYLKIDDDVVFAEDNAIPRLVTTLMKNPDALLVSSNVINNPALGWVHYHMGAVHPYMPETAPLTKHLASRDNGVWRPSDLPKRIEPPAQPFGVDEYRYMFGVDNDEDIPKHRWYPISDYHYLSKTPAAASQYDPFGNNLYFWPLAAQAHYSLLQNIEEKALDRYYMVHDIGKTKRGTPSVWRMTGTRLSINFMAIRGRDVFENRDTIARNDDEHTLTVDLPQYIDRSVLVETTSIVAHYSFGPQSSMPKTDLLERYHNYAREKVCPTGILEPESYWEYDDPPELSENEPQIEDQQLAEYPEMKSLLTKLEEDNKMTAAWEGNAE